MTGMSASRSTGKRGFLIRMEAAPIVARPLLKAPKGAIGRVSLTRVPTHLRDIARAAIAHHDFIWTSLRNLSTEKRELSVLGVEVEHIHAKGKELFKATCALENGDQEVVLVTATESNGRLALLGKTYRAVCEADPEHAFAHRFGAEAEVQVGKTGYKLFSVDYLAGHTLDEVVNTLESIVGIPGRPYFKGRVPSMETVDQSRLEQALNQLTDEFKLIIPEERDVILSARASSDHVTLEHWTLRLRELILVLDQEAVSAQAAFWQSSRYYQSDPRRPNIIFRVDEQGTRTYKGIDYDSLHKSGSLAEFILSYDIFHAMQHQVVGLNVVDATVRPWAWTYQEDSETSFSRHTFFEAIWQSLPSENRADVLTSAARGSAPKIAQHIYAFLIEKGAIQPSKATEIISA